MAETCQEINGFTLYKTGRFKIGLGTIGTRFGLKGTDRFAFMWVYIISRSTGKLYYRKRLYYPAAMEGVIQLDKPISDIYVKVNMHTIKLGLPPTFPSVCTVRQDARAVLSLSDFAGRDATYYSYKTPSSPYLKRLQEEKQKLYTLAVSYSRPIQYVPGVRSTRPDGLAFDNYGAIINDFRRGHMWGRFKKEGFQYWVKYPAVLMEQEPEAPPGTPEEPLPGEEPLPPEEEAKQQEKRLIKYAAAGLVAAAIASVLLGGKK